jgi:amino acid transporter
MVSVINGFVFFDSSKDWNMYILVGSQIVLFMIACLVSIIIIKNRNKQPLMKRSPYLIILSVIGNFLCLFNISICAIYFEKYQDWEGDAIIDK